MPAPIKNVKSFKLYNRVEPELVDELKILSAKHQKNPSELIRQVLWDFIDKENQSNGVSTD